MKKISLSVAFLLFGGVYFANAQVGIGTPTPATSSQLDIVANNKGVLIPRVTLTSTTSFGPIIGTEVESLLVYNTATAGDAAAIAAGTNVTPGFYYWVARQGAVNQHWERIVNQTQLDEAISNIKNIQTDLDKILALLKVAFPSNNLVNPEVTGDTHGGGMVFTPGNGTTTQAKIEYVYFNGTNYVTKDITADILDLIKGAESKTTILEFPADSGKFYYISEETINANAGVVPTSPFVTGTTLRSGVVYLDVPQSVIKNFETILDGTTTIVKPGTTNQFFTVEEYIQYLSSQADGNVIYKNIGTVASPNWVFQYWDATANSGTGGYVTINLTDLVGAAQSKTLLVETNTANAAVKQYYLSETFIVANTLNGVYTAPTQSVINGWTSTTLPTGVFEVDYVKGVSSNFQEILTSSTTITKTSTPTTYYTVQEYIEYLSMNNLADGVTKIVLDNQGQASFETWDNATNTWNLVNNTAFSTIVKANETNTTLTKDAVANNTEPIVYTYANENFIKGVAGATESKIEITADMVTSITNNLDVQNAITNILNKGGNVYFTKSAIVAGTPAGQLAIPANSFYTIENGIKVLINLADLVGEFETKTQIKRSEVAVDGTLPAFTASRTAPVVGTVKKGEIFYEYTSEDNTDFINVTADMISSITNNQEVIDAITNILNKGGNVFFGDHDGDTATPEVLYTVISNVNTPIDISGTVLQIITNNAENIKTILGDKINKTTVIKTGDTYNGSDVYIYTNTTTIAANSAETTGITIPAGIAPGTIIGIKVISANGISSNVTDIAITGQQISFNVGTGNMYNILGAGTYDVIVEFTAQ
jgi:hypothetical protein